MLRNIKNQQKSSDLSLINEKKKDLVTDPQQITFIMLIQWIIQQKKTLRIMNFQSRHSHSNLLFKSKN